MSRVALVSQRHDPTWTSPEVFIAGDETRRGLGEALAHRGWDVHVIVEAEFDDDRTVNGVAWHFRAADATARVVRGLGSSAGDAFPHIRSPAPHLVRAVDAVRADVIHSFDLVYSPLLWALGRLGPPLIAHFHGGQAARRPIWRQMETAAMRRTRRLLFTTLHHARPWIDNGYPATQVRTVFETSVEVGAGPTPSSATSGLVRQIGADPHRADLYHVGRNCQIPGVRLGVEPAVVCVGRLDAVKDPLTVLAGFAQLLSTHPAAVLHLAWTDAPLHAEVLARARLLGRPVVLHGRLSRAGARSLIAGASALVQGSTREVCGIAVLEAMALGVPPVVTRIPAFSAILGDCGAQFEPGDAGGLARALRAVLGAPDQPARCQARFNEALSFDAMACDVERVYRELV